jgi:two-component system response regulator YesN
VAKVLVVIDDDSEMEDLYFLLLEPYISKGSIAFNFFTSTNQFLNWFKNHPLDLLLTDIQMPELNGIELCRFLSKSGRNIPTYLVSGYDASDYLTEMQECSIKGFLSKPLDCRNFHQTLEAELGLSALYT